MFPARADGASCRCIYQRAAGPLEGVGGHFGRALLSIQTIGSILTRADADPVEQLNERRWAVCQGVRFTDDDLPGARNEAAR